MRSLLAATAVVMALALGWWIVAGRSAPERSDGNVAIQQQPSAPSDVQAPTASAASTSEADQQAAADPAPAPAAAPEPARVPIEVDPRLAGLRIVDGAGDPIEGAVAAFTPWSGDLWALGGEGTLPATRHLEERSESSTTGGDGRLSALPGTVDLEAGWYGSVLWAAKPGFRAGVRLAPYGDATPLFDGDLALPAVAPPRVLVTDESGQPVSGARIEVRLAAHPVYSGVERPKAVHARAVFHFIAASNVDGSAALPAGPLDESRLPDVVRVRAVTAAAASDWHDVAPGEVANLRLEPSFTVTGRVDGAAAWMAPNSIPPAVILERDTGLGWTTVATCGLDVDEEFGPVDLPCSPHARYRARIDGTTCLPNETLIDGVAPGRELNVVLEAILGEFLWIEVLESSTAERRLDATVAFEWTGQAGRVTRTAGLSVLDGDTYHLSEALPPDVPIRAIARAEGLAPSALDNLELPTSSGQVQQVWLQSAAPLSGRIDGLQPMPPAIDLLIAPQATNRPVRVRAELGPDGSFELPDAPAEPLWCAAVTHSGGRSTVAQAAGEAERHVVLHFDRELTLSGQVVGRDDGLPLANAAVATALFVDSEGVPFGEPVVVDAAGRFRIELGPTSVAGLALVVDAPGHVRLVQAVTAPAERAVDLGRLALTPSLGAALVFESPKGRQLEGAAFWATGPTQIERRPLDSTGRVELGDVALGYYQCSLAEHGGSHPRSIGVQLRVPDEEITVTLDGDGELVVVLPPARSSGDAFWCDIQGWAGSVSQTLRQNADPDQSELRFDELPLGEWTVELIDRGSGQTLAQDTASLSPSQPHARVELAIPDSVFWIRVVDEGGAPVADANVVGRNTAGTLAPMYGRTDSEGLIPYTSEPLDDLVLDVVGPSGGTALDLAVEPELRRRHTSRDDPLVVELGTDSAAAVRLSDADRAPLEGLSIAFRDRTHSALLGPTTQTDADGVARIDGIGAGPCMAVVDDDRFVPTAIRLVAAPEPEVRPVMLHRRSPLTVWVVDGEGTPIEGAQVSVRSDAVGTHALEAYPWYGIRAVPEDFSTGADGALVMSGLPEGPLRVQVTAGEKVVEATAELDPNRQTAIEVAVELE